MLGRDRVPRSPSIRLSLFVILEATLDQTGHVVLALLVFEESVVRNVVAGVGIVNRRVLLSLVSLHVRERDQFGISSVGLGLLDLAHTRRNGGRSARERGRLEGCAALRACDRVSVQIVEPRAAGHALALQAEVRFRHDEIAWALRVRERPVSREVGTCQMQEQANRLHDQVRLQPEPL